jgi:molybdopterin-guanine dinucleotide biosynthesis protein A
MCALNSIRDAAAFILAGGKSSRMGEDKARLKLQGHTLLEIAIGKAREVVDTVGIVGPRASFGPDAIEDIYPDCGPLGGIHSAVTHSSCDFNLILAVDVPFVEAPFLCFLLQQAQASHAVATLARTSDGFQPLCAVYQKSFAQLAEKALKKQRYKIDALFPLVQTRIIAEDELRQLAFDPAMFQNLNTRVEYERAKARQNG